RGMERRAMPLRLTLPNLPVVARGFRQLERAREVRRVEGRELQRDRERTRRRTKQRLVQVRVERGEFLGGRFLGQLRVRPETLQRSRGGRLGPGDGPARGTR